MEKSKQMLATLIYFNVLKKLSNFKGNNCGYLIKKNYTSKVSTLKFF